MIRIEYLLLLLLLTLGIGPIAWAWLAALRPQQPRALPIDAVLFDRIVAATKAEVLRELDQAVKQVRDAGPPERES